MKKNNCFICSKDIDTYYYILNSSYICEDCICTLLNKGMPFSNIKLYEVDALKSIVEDASIENLSGSHSQEITLNRLNINGIKKRYIAFDIETTGLSNLNDRIVELGAVLFEDGIVIDSFSSLLNPGKTISPGASEVSGITNDMIMSSPIEEEVFPDFIKFMKNAFNGEVVICAHNASFDIGFLTNTLKRLGYNCNIKYLDTLALSRKVLKNSVINHKQDTVAAYFNIVNPQSHRAVTDAETCGKILYNLIPLYEDIISKD